MNFEPARTVYPVSVTLFPAIFIRRFKFYIQKSTSRYCLFGLLINFYDIAMTWVYNVPCYKLGFASKLPSTDAFKLY